ncbi:NB-ARC domain-containing protein [Nocardia ninae]
MIKAIGMLPKRRKIPDTDVSWHDAASIIFGFTALGPTVERQLEGIGGDYNKRIRHLQNIAAYTKSERQFERVTASIRTEIALRLREMEEFHLTPAEELPDPGYVSRPSPQKEILNAVRRGDKIVFLHGDAGTGKSSLAVAIGKQLVRGAPDVNTLIIDGQSEEALIDTVERFIEEHARSVDLPTSIRPWAALRTLLASDDAPQVTILDNIQDSNTLRRVLPVEPRHRVIVTSRRKLIADPTAASVFVGNMEDEEAQELVAAHAPTLDSQQVAEVAEMLDNRPLAIVHGCACLSRRPFNNNISEFKAELLRAPEILGGYGNEDDTTLHRIYSVTVDQLSQHQDSYSLLSVIDILLVFGGRFHEFDIVGSLLYPPSRAGDPTKIIPYDQVKFDKAVRILQDRSLIQPGEFVVMHDLTVQMLRSIRKADLQATIATHIQTLLFRLDVSLDDSSVPRWLGGWPAPTQWRRFVAPIAVIRRVINWLDRAASASDGEAVNLRHVHRYLTAVHIRQLREIGQLSIGLKVELIKSLADIIHERDPEVVTSTTLVLMRELIDLGYFEDVNIMPQSPEKSILADELMIATGHQPELMALRAVMISEFRPIGELITALGSRAPNIEQVVAISRLAHATGPGMRLHAAFYAGVYNLEQAHWQYAEDWFRKCLAMCHDLENEWPEAISLRLACHERLIELGIYSGNYQLCRDFIVSGMKLVDDPDLNEDVFFDRVLLHRFERVGMLATLELDYHPTATDPADRADLQTVIDDFSDTVSTFEELGMGLQTLETKFMRIKAGAYGGIPQEQICNAIMNIHQDLVDMQVQVGAAICRLSVIKMKLAVADSRDLLVCIEELIQLVSLFKQFSSNYWHADALNTIYAASLIANVPEETIHEARSTARSALMQIGRTDRFELANAVAASREKSPMLLWI